MIQRIVELISQQLSRNAIELLHSFGLLKVNDFKIILDYKENNEQHFTMITIGDSVFLCASLFPTLGTEVVVIGSIMMDQFISVRKYRKGECIETQVVSEAEFGIIDLSNNGERWEGMVYNNMPFGYGTIYTENNTKKYTGFNYAGYTMGFGTDYYLEGNSIPAYEGMFCFGKRHGMGTLFNRHGKPVGETGYLYGQVYMEQIIRVPENTQLQLFHNTLMYMYIIEKNCYQQTTSFRLSRYPFLKSVQISDDCFCNGMGKDQIFSIESCPKLESIEIGNRSFVHFEHCTLQNLPSLTTVTIGTLQRDCQSFHTCRTLRFIS